MNSCRICLFKVEPSDCKSIFATGRNETYISDMIIQFADVQVSENDGFSKIICSNCLEKLNTTYDFKDLIIESDKQLREQRKGFNEDKLAAMVTIKCEDSKIKTDDTNENIHQCDECLKIFKRKKYLQVHKTKHKGTHTCDVCKKTFSSNWAMNVHKKIHLPNSDKPVDFPAEESKQDALLVKIEESPAVKPQPTENKCDECDKVFKSKKYLKAHRAIHTGNLPFSCDVCNKGFPVKWAMTVHRRIHFDERPFKCEYENCDKAFKMMSALILHRQLHQGIKKYCCHLCGKGFAQLTGFRVHQRHHTQEKPFICDVCGKHYSSEGDFKRHCKRHVEQPDYQPCPTCGKLYINLKRHVKTVHAETRVRFPCEVCNKEFCTKEVLKTHKRIHDGVKPYSCNICGKRFTQSSVANLHKRVHTGEMPFNCVKCNRRFAYKHHLKKHVERDHLDDESQ